MKLFESEMSIYLNRLNTVRLTDTEKSRKVMEAEMLKKLGTDKIIKQKSDIYKIRKRRGESWFLGFSSIFVLSLLFTGLIFGNLFLSTLISLFLAFITMFSANLLSLLIEDKKLDKLRRMIHEDEIKMQQKINEEMNQRREELRIKIEQAENEAKQKALEFDKKNSSLKEVE